MKNIQIIDDNVLRFVTGGTEASFITEFEGSVNIDEHRYGYGKTQPGHNDDIFRDR